MGGKKHKKKPKPPRPPVAPATAPVTAAPVPAAAAVAPPPPPYYVFDRERTTHFWEAALEPLSSRDNTHLAVQESWRMEARVEERREKALLAAEPFRARPLSYAEWALQVEEHYRDYSWQACGDLANSGNRIRGGPSPSEELTHVVSLGRLLRFLLKKNRKRNVFRKDWVNGFPTLKAKLPALGDIDYLDRVWEIAQELNSRGPSEVRRAAGFLADQLGPTEPPWWAGFATELRPFFASEDWLRLSRILGLGHLRAGETLLLFQYRVQDVALAAGRLMRPTVVEAAISPYHFPSPETSTYGFTMPLEGTSTYCRELIHPPLKGAIAERACTGQLVRLDSNVFEDYALLPGLRAQQRLRLEKEWPDPETQAWLRRHAPAGSP